MSLIEPRGLNKYSNGVLLTVNNPKILKITKLTNLERDYPERYFREKKNALNPSAQHGDLVWSSGTHDVRVSSVQNFYRQVITASFERIFEKLQI